MTLVTDFDSLTFHLQMLPFGGQGANMAIEDGGALGFLFEGITDAGQVEKRLSLFEQVRKNRASRVQILSSVRIHREKEVEAKVRQYADSPDSRKSAYQNRLHFLFYPY